MQSEPKTGAGSEPKKVSNLAQRLGTAVVLIPLLVISMFVETTTWSMLGICVLAVALAGDEFMRMALGVHASEDKAYGLRATVALAGVGIMLANTFLGTQTAMAPIMFVAVAAVSVAVLARKQYLAQAGRHLSYAIAGLAYVPMLACVWPLLKKECGPEWLFLALALAFGSDTVAYFGGRLFGKHKLYEAVSPKKTREGAVGGLVGGVLAMVGLGHFWLAPTLPLVDAIVLGLLGSVLGQIGDLVASMLKRTFGVKDSGNVLPGHGGMLDRVDGLLFVAPLIFYYAKLYL